jgi:phenylpropionate dioxygenase-like ring-hydroxylating dioxygenase large terminal subunit
MVDVADPKIQTSSEPKQSPSRREASPRQDVRELIPPLGLREYWYPLIEASSVPKNKPLGMKICGEDLALFRDDNNEVAALWNVCPHRGGSLMHGDCHYPGTISCPYHGWTFNGEGEVLAVLPEGPDSKIPGQVKAKKFPTKTLKGMVFVWMGEQEPAPIEEDVPPEFFDDISMILYFTEIWPSQWNVALENGSDAHVPYVHRDAWRNFITPSGPFTGSHGGRQRIVNNRAVITGGYTGRQVTNGASGNSSELQGDRATRSGLPNTWKKMVFPNLKNATWPKHEWRNLWTWMAKPGSWRKPPVMFGRDEFPEEWGSGHHLPSMYRGNRGNVFYTRACVAIDEHSSRQLYYKAARPGNWLGRVYEQLHWKLWGKRQQANFSHQDIGVVMTQRYDTPEYLSATDIHQVFWRRLVMQARGMHTEGRNIEITEAEKVSYASLRGQGVDQEDAENALSS